MERAAFDVYTRIIDILTNPRHAKWIILVLLLWESVFCGLIIRTVQYTEIDWRAYMQQVELYLAGERDYTKIRGDTGPLVYPALHVYIYRALHAMTSGGNNITLAEIYFSALYVFNLGLAMACYYQAQAPPYIYPMLILSKRLHSIYVLRFFNDGFAMTGLFVAILCYQKRQWTWGSAALSCGMAVKMNLLLVLPAVGLILYQALGLFDAFMQLSVMFQVQLLVGLEFLRTNPKGYLLQAFDFRRQFLYQWTVNWRFVNEDVFLSRDFAIALLVAHVSILLFFMLTRWTSPMGVSIIQELRSIFVPRSPEEQKRVRDRVTPEFILTTMLTANAIGMLCARSLHYQFFSWIGWATPFLLYRSKLHWVLQYFIWSGQELAWNKYPSNDLSSKIVVGVLALTVLEVWVATDDTPDLKNVNPEMLRKAQARNLAGAKSINGSFKMPTNSSQKSRRP